MEVVETSERPYMKEIGEAEAEIYVKGAPGGTPITVIGTKAIRDGFDATALQQAINTRSAPGVSRVVLNPDAHAGFGAPIGCVLVSPDHIYPGPVGVDIKCSMSLLQLDVPVGELASRTVRRALIDAICERTPTGAGKGTRSVPKARSFSFETARRAVIEGATRSVCDEFGIPTHWAERCEDAFHRGHDESTAALESRLDRLVRDGVFSPASLREKLQQIGSYGGGNHFGECNAVEVVDAARAKAFGLRDGHAAFLSHCGSRGFGNLLAVNQFKVLQAQFSKWAIPFPGDDRELVYAPLGSTEANNYLDDMAMGGNFATVNHLLINALVLEAFQQVLPGTKGELVYFISHNIARREVIDGRPVWVHRKGATRAYPAGHASLAGTVFAETGHPILLPGNPRDGSVVMVAEAGARKSCYSVNHGAGRAMGRRHAMRTLDQKAVDREFADLDILANTRQYPIDEAPDAYKDFKEVLRSVELAGLASRVANLKARFVIKDGDQSLKGAA
ncbi:RtcB family protein [bacterium]|nr:RtcB family protein [bacterium]